MGSVMSCQFCHLKAPFLMAPLAECIEEARQIALLNSGICSRCLSNQPPSLSTSSSLPKIACTAGPLRKHTILEAQNLLATSLASNEKAL